MKTKPRFKIGQSVNWTQLDSPTAIVVGIDEPEASWCGRFFRIRFPNGFQLSVGETTLVAA